MAGLGSIFQYEEINTIVEEAMEEFSLFYAEATYEDPEEQASMVFMSSEGEFHEARSDYCWLDKNP